ncbi:MAG: phosphatase PAP2 family protein [Flavobacteriales bacterium]|nr:phosphatase PAP2 family protein [Flavobacteriales bacterium]
MLFSVVPLASTAQTAHGLQLGRELAFAGAGLGVNGIGLLLRHMNSPKPAPGINMERVPAIDRWSTQQWQPGAHRASNVLFLGAVTASFAGGFVLQGSDRPFDAAAITAESFLLTSGLTSIAKELVRRPRPYRFNPDVPDAMHHPREDFVSFWSGHAANTAAVGFSMAALVQRSDASPGMKGAVWAGALAAPLCMGYLRMRAGKHFLTDVFVGALVGTAVGLAVPYFHRESESYKVP